jgi:hypothetical protein
MANSQGRVYRFGSPATLALYDSNNNLVVTGYVSPDMESYDLTHEADTEEVRNSSGEVVGHITYNNRLTLTVNFIPAGTTSAEALKAMSLPDANGTCILTGAPAVQCGGYADALNAATGNRWIYSGGGSLKFTQTGKVTGTITLKRYTNLSASGAATSL